METTTEVKFTQPGDLITVETAAEILGVSMKSVYALVSDGRLKAVKFRRQLLRIHRSDLERLIVESAVRPVR